MRDIISKNQTKKINRRLLVLGTERAKWRKFARMARIVFALAVIGALVLNSARFGFAPRNSAEAATTVFTETFSTTTYRDAPSTDANWDTAAGNVESRDYTSLGWGKMNLTSGTDNLSNTSGNSNDVQFILDSNNRPFVVWDDAETGAGDIYFSKWSGSAWVKADGTAGYDNISNNAGASYSPRIQLDSSNRPNISWTDETTGSGDIYFSKWSGSAWVKADGTAGYDNVSNNAFTPYISYLLLDSTGKPQIVWDDNYDGATTGDIYFSKWSGSAWVKADGATAGYDNISNNAGVSLTSDFKIYSDNPYILWWDDAAYAGGGMLFSKWNGTNWTKADGTTTSPSYDNISSLSSSTGAGGNFQIAGGNPYVAWLGWDGSDDEIFFTKWSGAAWVKADGTAGYNNISNNSGTAGVPLIKLDSSSNPYLVWDDSTTGTNDIYFSKWSGTAWVKANGDAGYDNVSNNAGTSTYPQFQLDFNWRPNVVWYDNTGGNYDIYFSKWSGSNWTMVDGTTAGYDNISNNSGTSYSSQIQLDSTGRPQIIWEDNTAGNYEIYSRKWNTGAYYVGSTVQSLKINGAITNITKATLTATQTLNGQSVAYEMTNNGGTSWNSVTSGVEYTFSSAANDLRWRATILTANDTLTPVIDTVAISYVNDNAPNAPALNSPSNAATEISLTPPLQTTATDGETDDVQYKIELTLNSLFPSWTKADGTTLGYNNISNNAGDSRVPQIQLDSTGRPFVVWHDFTVGNYEIYFSKWNGSNWTKADGTTLGYDNISNNANTSYFPQIQLDSTERPFVVWSDITTGNYDIYFSKWNGSNWTKADGTTLGYDNISNNAGDSYYPKIQLDSTGRPFVVWNDETTGGSDIYFSKWNGSNWVKADNSTLGYDNVSNNAGAVYGSQIQLDSTGRPFVVWHDGTTGGSDIYFSKWSGSNWTKADGTTLGYDNISNNAGGSYYPQIQLDSTERPFVVWYDFTVGNNEIYFSKWSGSAWVKADGTTLGYDNISNNAGYSYEPQIQLDSTGRPFVVWNDDTAGNYDIYFSKWNGSNWTKADGTTLGYDNISEDNDGESFGPQIQLDSTGRPFIVWYDDTTGNNEIYFTKWNGSNWTKADGTTLGYDNISDSDGGSYYPQIQLDPTGRPFVVWDDYTDGNYEIYFSKRNSTANLYVYDQTSSQTGWSGQNSGTGTRYTSGTIGTYTISSALSSCATYYWRSFAKDPLGLNIWSSASSSNTFTTTGCTPPNTAPSATVPNTISQSTDGLGRISFQTAISDSDSNNTKLKVEYSEDNGTTWYDAQLASVSPSAGTVDLTNSNAYQIGTSDAIDTSTGSKTLTIVWDTKSSSNGNGALTGDQTDIKVRVTPNDSTADGTGQVSSAFEVDNLNPSGLGSLSFSGVTTDQIAASWSQATEANFQRYRLYYGTSQSDIENQTSSYYQSTSISTAQTTITSLTSATTYYFKLFATDIYGNSSSTSTANQATLTPSVVIPPPPVPPPAPEPTPEPEAPPEEVPAEEEPEEQPKPSAPLVTSISEGETVNQNTFTLSGVAPSHSIVIMVLDNRSITQTATNSSGTFTFFLFNLTDGSHTLRLQTKDADGNVSDPAYFTFRVDVPRELEKTEEEQRIYPEAAPAEVPPTGGEIPGVSGEAGGADGPSIPITPSPIEEAKEVITPSREERLLPQVVQTITKTIAEAPKAVINAVAKIQEIIPKPHQKWEEQTPIEKTVNVAAQTVVTTGAATGVALSTGLVTLNVGRLAVTFADVNLMLIRAFTTLLSVAGIRRKKSKPWGTVYDSQTKQPLDPAYVQLLDEKGNELETQITDLEGRFGFFVKQSGTYSLFANKTNYKFPSERLKGKSGDELYDNLYFGIPISLQEGQILNISVPMDSEKFDWNEFAKKEQGYVKVNPKTEILKKKLSKYAFYSGLVFTPVSYLFSPSKFNLFIVGIYFLIFVLRMFNVKEKQYGMAYNKQTGQPFSFAAVRAVYPGIDKTVKSVVADKFGRYYLIVPNGKYYLRVEKKNPDGSYTLIHQTAPFDVKKGIITSDVEA